MAQHKQKRNSGKLTAFILLLIISAGLLCIGKSPYAYLTSTILQGTPETPVIVLDPGHGGYDPGKIGTDQSLEKNINLSIAEYLKNDLEQNNYHVVMTRSDDSDYSNIGNGSKKTNDLNNRINIINEAAPIMVISIHQNSYVDSNSKGAQVFYYGDTNTDSESKKIADSIQASLVNDVDPSNHRVAKNNTSYYMLKKTAYPTVIVECGFLSNPEETKNLNDPAYQQKIAQAICSGIINYRKLVH